MYGAMVQTLMGMVGSIGFSILFGVKGPKLIGIALGSGGGWAVYLLVTGAGYRMFAGLFAASLFVAAISELFARAAKAPVTSFLMPMLIPEIPGGDLYYTMYYLVQGRYMEFNESSNRVLFEAAAIALGIMLVSQAVGFIGRLRLKARLTNKKEADKIK